MRDGSERLKKWLAETKLSQADFATKAGLSESLVSLLLSGQRRPGISAATIERATEGAVPATSWLRTLRRPRAA